MIDFYMRNDATCAPSCMATRDEIFTGSNLEYIPSPATREEKTEKTTKRQRYAAGADQKRSGRALAGGSIILISAGFEREERSLKSANLE